MACPFTTFSIRPTACFATISFSPLALATRSFPTIVLSTSVRPALPFSPLAGLAYDLGQSYTAPILAGALVNAASIACLLRLGEPRPWPARAQGVDP